MSEIPRVFMFFVSKVFVQFLLHFWL